MINNQLDIFHRAFRAYKQEVEKSEDAKKFIKAIQNTDNTLEHIETKRSECIIKTDWIEAIERALPYIDEAIKQNRQFILQTGETVLIEKVKRVSKTSVEHLAHHSELITHIPEENGDLIPDKLYVAENMSNYAVYENRFLYALLCLTRDFTEARYLKIVELWNTFDSDLSIEKNVTVGKRNLVYSLKLHEKSTNDRSTSYDRDTIDRLARIKNIRQAVNAFLQTPLMKEVSLAPLLKPPITRTNVIRMDPAFCAAAALYDFLLEYEGPGYIPQDIYEKMDSFPDVVGENFAEGVAVASYLTYRYGGKLDAAMEREYELEQKALRERLEKEEKEKLDRLKQEMMAGSLSADAYISALEARLLKLEEQEKQQTDLAEKYEENAKALATLTERDKILTDDIQLLKNKLAEQQLNETRLRGTFDAQLADREQALVAAEARHEQDLEALRQQTDAAIAEANARTEQMEQKYSFTAARLHALRHEHGLITPDEDFSSRESFLELEKEREAFKKFFNTQWKITKKKLRKKIGDSMKQEFEDGKQAKKASKENEDKT